MEKFLIVGLGNIGPDYEGTRHNIGFRMVEALADSVNSVKGQPTVWEDRRYGFITRISVKGRQLILLKPSTYMNLSGNAVRYWLQKENIDQQHLLVIVDELALPLGTFRLKGNGSNGGHNGLGHIQQLIGTQYPRLRMGIGNTFGQGHQVDWVLGNFSEEEKEILQPAIDTAVEIIKSFVLAGIDITMNQYNKRGVAKKQPQKPEE